MKISTVLLVGLASIVIARPIPSSHPAGFEHSETTVNGKVVEDDTEAIPQGSLGSGAPLIDSDSSIFDIADKFGGGYEYSYV
jgi:hypothetical protein